MSSASAAALRSTAVNVKIVSDVVWPFCFVGLRHLQQASQKSGIPVQLTWEPFLLNPRMPQEGEDLAAHLYGKYGSRGVQMMNDPNAYLYVAGRKVGIEFTKDRNIYPTQKAHALMEYVKEKVDNEKANQIMEEMYVRYFEKGHNINSDTVLKEIATKFGVDAEKAQEVIQDGKYLKEIDDKDQIAKRRMGISGVPFYIVEQKSGGQPVGFSGAQPVDLIAEVLEEAAEE